VFKINELLSLSAVAESPGSLTVGLNVSMEVWVERETLRVNQLTNLPDMRPFLYFLLAGLLLGDVALAQSGSAGRPLHRVRSIERAYDLPYLTVEAPQPGQAADLTTVVIYAPDSMEIGLTIGEWMSHREPAWQKAERIGPGRQELTLPLYALADGDYTLRIYRRNRVVAAKHFVVAK